MFHFAPALLILATFVFCGWFSFLTKKAAPVANADLDQMVLDRLKAAGSDLSKPHSVDFFLYFPTQNLAVEAEKEIKLEVDSVKIGQDAGTTEWFCEAHKKMVPEHAELVRLRKRFNEITTEFKGAYDGWGAGVEK